MSLMLYFCVATARGFQEILVIKAFHVTKIMAKTLHLGSENGAEYCHFYLRKEKWH